MEEIKQIPFSTIKEKIIKTDDVIKCYLKIENEYAKCKKQFEFLKTSNEQLKIENNRLVLDNERLNFNHNTVQTKISSAEKEISDLRQQILELERQYNKRVIEHQSQLIELEFQQECRNLMSQTEKPTKQKSSQTKKGSKIEKKSPKKSKALEKSQIELEEKDEKEKDDLLLDTSLENIELTDILSDIGDIDEKTINISPKSEDDFNENILEDIFKEMIEHPPLVSPLSFDNPLIKEAETHLVRKPVEERSNLNNQQCKLKNKYRNCIRNRSIRYYRQIINIFSQRRHLIRNKFKRRNIYRNNILTKQNLQKLSNFDNQKMTDKLLVEDKLLFEDGVIVAAIKKLKELNLNFSITTNSVDQSCIHSENRNLEKYLTGNYTIDKLVSLGNNTQNCSLVVEQLKTKNEKNFVGFINSNNNIKNYNSYNLIVNNSINSLITNIQRKRKHSLQEILTIDSSSQCIKQTSNCQNRIDTNVNKSIARISPQRRTNQNSEEFSNKVFLSNSSEDLSKFPKKRKLFSVNNHEKRDKDFVTNKSEFRNVKDNFVNKPKFCDISPICNKNPKAIDLHNVIMSPQKTEPKLYGTSRIRDKNPKALILQNIPMSPQKNEPNLCDVSPIRDKYSKSVIFQNVTLSAQKTGDINQKLSDLSPMPNKTPKAVILQNVTISPQKSFVKFSTKSENNLPNQSLDISICTAKPVTGIKNCKVDEKNIDKKLKDCFNIPKIDRSDMISIDDVIKPTSLHNISVDDKTKLASKEITVSKDDSIKEIAEKCVNNSSFTEILNENELSTKELDKIMSSSDSVQNSNDFSVDNLEAKQLENKIDNNLDFITNCDDNKSSTKNNVLSNDTVSVKKGKKCKKKGKKPSDLSILWNKLMIYSYEEEIVNEIITELKKQNPLCLCKNILHRICNDFYDKPVKKHSHLAPMLTETQRICIGLLIKLDSADSSKHFLDNYLQLTEKTLLLTKKLEVVGPLARVYTALCKLTKNINRIRLFCMEAFYFMSDLVVPMLFTILTTWIEVFPKFEESQGNTLIKVFIHIIQKKSCSQPGYNLFTLKKLLSDYYGYKNELVKSDELFNELFNNYLSHPANSTITSLILFMKHENSEWVLKKMNSEFIPLYYKVNNNNFKKTILLLFGYICRQFKCINETETKGLNDLKKWMSSVIAEEPLHLIQQDKS